MTSRSLFTERIYFVIGWVIGWYIGQVYYVDKFYYKNYSTICSQCQKI